MKFTLSLVRPPASPGQRDVVSRLASSTRFRTFVTLLVATQLIDDLRGRGPYIVLAPTDAAVDALPVARLQRLSTRVHADALVDLGENHVAAHALGPSGAVRTLFGTSLRLERGRVTPTDARVVERWQATNGIVLALDRVLLTPRG